MSVVNKVLNTLNTVSNKMVEHWLPITLSALVLAIALVDSCTAVSRSKELSACKESCLPSQFEIISESCWCYGENSSSMMKSVND